MTVTSPLVTTKAMLAVSILTIEEPFPGQHYAFRVGPAEFRTILKRAQDMRLKYWSTPRGGGVGETYELDGETGFYFHDPAGHQLEVLTDTQGLT